VRFVKQIPHPHLTIQVFVFNEKYILKLEIGGYEQIFKVPVDLVGSTEPIENMIDETFIDGCMSRFLTMRNDFETKLKKP
jgi:hypothetical protein